MFGVILANKIFRGVAILLFLLAALFIFGYISTQNKIAKMESELADVSLSNVKIKGDIREYEIKNGKVYRGSQQLRKTFQSSTVRKVLSLASFYQKTKEDPLFTAPGFSSKDFELAVSNLKQVQNSLIEKKEIESEVFPTMRSSF